MDFLGPRSQTLGTWLAVLLAGSWALYELQKDDQLPTGATMSSKLLPILLIATLFITAAMHVIAAVINRRQPKPLEGGPQGIDPVKHKEVTDRLNECESLLKHWEGEVGREQLLRKEQVEIRETQIADLNKSLHLAKSQLSLAEAGLAKYSERLSTPRARLKITRGRYWTEHPQTGEVHERDVTEILDNMVLDEKLVLDKLYQTIFPEPLKHVRKKLTVDYWHGTRQFSVTVPESMKLELPFPYDEIAFPN